MHVVTYKGGGGDFLLFGLFDTACLGLAVRGFLSLAFVVNWIEGRLPSSAPAKPSLGRKRGVLIPVPKEPVAVDAGRTAIAGVDAFWAGDDVGDGGCDITFT